MSQRPANVKGFRCLRCNYEFATGDQSSRCSKCAANVEVVMSLPAASEKLRETIASRSQGMWRWKEFLPVDPSVLPVTLGEGDTPLVQSPRLSQELGFEHLFFKLEYLLPTGSLKDRSVALALTHAKSIGATTATVATTGNNGASLAAYAAAANIESIVFVPKKTDPLKIKQTLAYGSKVVLVNGTLRESVQLMNEAIVKFGWYPCIPSNPFRNEAKKTCAFEVWEQLDDEAPDFMIHPIAVGFGLSAAWKGFNELKQLGWSKKIPKMIGAQAAEAAPFAKAWSEGLTEIGMIAPQPTCAESIALSTVPPGTADRTLLAMRESGGTLITSSEAAILKAYSLLASHAGLFVEPSAATALAAAVQLKEQGSLKAKDVVVCFLTGSGFKQNVEQDHRTQLYSVEPTLLELERQLKRNSEI